MYSITPDITEDFLLKNLSQEQIMEHYIGLPIKIKKKFSSPFREDKHPSCSLVYKEGRLVFSDFATNLKGNCFHVVMHKYRLNYYEALEKIAEDFNLKSPGALSHKIKVEYSHLDEEKKKSFEPSKIAIKHRGWKKIDKEYWFDRFGLTREILEKFNVIPVDTAWVNGNIVYNDYGNNDPCYAYRFGKNQYKLYFPLRKHKDPRGPRFLHNTNKVQGYRQLPKNGDFLIFTKSLKDVMVAYSLGVNAIALVSESIYPPEKLIDVIKSRFKYVYSFYDFDYAGICMANHFKRVYNIRPILLSDGTRGTKTDYGAKDLSEYVEKYGKEKAQKLIQNLKTQFETQHEEQLEEDNEIYY